MSKRPNCRHCNKPLARYRWRDEEWAKKAGKGDWGGYGDGYFCGKTCGHLWAVWVIKHCRVTAEEVL